MTIHAQHLSTITILLDILNERYNATSELNIRIWHDMEQNVVWRYELKIWKDSVKSEHNCNDTDSLILFLVKLMCGTITEGKE